MRSDGKSSALKTDNLEEGGTKLYSEKLDCQAPIEYLLYIHFNHIYNKLYLQFNHFYNRTYDYNKASKSFPKK